MAITANIGLLGEDCSSRVVSEGVVLKRCLVCGKPIKSFLGRPASFCGSNCRDVSKFYHAFERALEHMRQVRRESEQENV